MEKYKITEEKVFSFIEKHHIFRSGDKVVLGVSGGADSVCLLFMMYELARRKNLLLYVVHINHKIRQDAGKDAKYVESLCNTMKLPFYLVEKNIAEMAKSQHRSEEEMGRIVRYEAFSEIADENGAGKIAVAHNMNDKSETMLFNLFRGTGIKGLGSIRPVRERIVRPLLCLERTEIEEYLNERGIRYCIDSTNEKDDYTRNRIRHHILPYAEQEIAEGSIRHIANTSMELGEIDDYLTMQTDKLKKSSVEITKNGYILDIAGMETEHSVIVKRLIHVLLLELSPYGRDITGTHVADVHGLLSKKGNYRLCLPFGIKARKEYGKIYLYRQPDNDECSSLEAASADKLISGTKYELKYEILPYNADDSAKTAEVPQNKYTKWFDYDKIEQALVVRTRMQGDFISVADREAGEVHKSLKKYFIDEKISAADRDRIILLADGSHIIWIIGYRISEHYKVTEKTKRILQVKVEIESDETRIEETED
jgi:tRNA(Ile)-lysidine synthase